MPNIRTTQQPRIAVTTDPSSPVDATQLARVAVTLANVPVVPTQMARVAVTRPPANLILTQVARIVVTRNFVPGSDGKCSVYVVT
jgi:hypothetical protein